MARQHPNKTKMQAAVQRWIGEALGRDNGAALLARRADWVVEQIAILGRDDLSIPAHLAGLTLWDLQAAEGALRGAVRAPDPLAVDGDWGDEASRAADLPERPVFARHAMGQTIFYADEECRNLAGWFTGLAAEGESYSDAKRGLRFRLTLVAAEQARAA